ncbi:MAG: PD40 domain-containing protein [Candidatus Schekmanbacteria bacterium]|nr:PD40 domain-containing protein [Candidatus Schekmanbacteria bacterium]
MKRDLQAPAPRKAISRAAAALTLACGSLGVAVVAAQPASSVIEITGTISLHGASPGGSIVVLDLMSSVPALPVAGALTALALVAAFLHRRQRRFGVPLLVAAAALAGGFALAQWQAETGDDGSFVLRNGGAAFPAGSYSIGFQHPGYISKSRELEVPSLGSGSLDVGAIELFREPPQTPQCAKPPHTRVDAHTPSSAAPDWGQPVRLGAAVNTPCPEDAIEISGDGQRLYFLFTTDVLENLTPEGILSPDNSTYVSTRGAGPADWGTPALFDLGRGVDQSLDGEVSFSPDGNMVYFHSLRATNTGYTQDPPLDDILDVYAADVVGGVPGPGSNLGAPPNSEYLDGEQAIHPDGVTLYFASTRPGGEGGYDLWSSRREGSAWNVPVAVGPPINSYATEIQPTFSADGTAMYFSSDRGGPAEGMAIYRSALEDGAWSAPELVIRGIAGEPALTSDGAYLYFVHVLTDPEGTFDADIWYSARVP